MLLNLKLDKFALHGIKRCINLYTYRNLGKCILEKPKTSGVFTTRDKRVRRCEPHALICCPMTRNKVWGAGTLLKIEASCDIHVTIMWPLNMWPLCLYQWKSEWGQRALWSGTRNTLVTCFFYALTAWVSRFAFLQVIKKKITPKRVVQFLDRIGWWGRSSHWLWPYGHGWLLNLAISNFSIIQFYAWPFIRDMWIFNSLS